MNEEIITFNPAAIVVDDRPTSGVSPWRTGFWLLALTGGIGCLIGNLLLRLVYLPRAGAATFDPLSVTGLALHLLGCYFAGAAVGLAPRRPDVNSLHPRTRVGLILSLFVLVLNVLFLAGLIAAGAFTLTSIR